MTYDLDDILRLMQGAPSFSLTRREPFIRFVGTLEEAARECREVLDAYPNIRYQPLDFLYLSLQSLGALDADLMQDLVEVGKKGAVWACWLAMLSPRPEFRNILDRVEGRHTHYQWCVEFAQSLIDGQVRLEDAEQARLITSIRNAIKNLPLPKVDLSRMPTGEQLEHLQAQRDAILRRYREEGMAAARAHALQAGLIKNRSTLLIENVAAEAFRVRGVMMPVLQASITPQALEASGHLQVFRDCDDLDEYDAALFSADGVLMSWQRYDGTPDGPFTLAIDELTAGERSIDIPEYASRVLAQLGIAPAFVVWRNPYFQMSVIERAPV